MRFANARAKAEWQHGHLDPLLKNIVTVVARYARVRWRWYFTVTSVYRTPKEDSSLKASGIHCEWRAVDVRTRDVATEVIEDVARYANARWIYDPKRPHLKICFAELHGTGPHAHFQVHPNTTVSGMNDRSRETAALMDLNDEPHSAKEASGKAGTRRHAADT